MNIIYEYDECDDFDYLEYDNKNPYKPTKPLDKNATKSPVEPENK